MTYRDAAGTPIATTSYTIPPETRISYDLNDYPPGQPLNIGYVPQLRGGDDLCLEVNATYDGIVLTKIVYWERNFNWNEGASTTGHSRGGNKVVIPGGTVESEFWHFVQIMNVGAGGTDVYVTNYWSNGTPSRRAGGLVISLERDDAARRWSTSVARPVTSAP